VTDKQQFKKGDRIRVVNDSVYQKYNGRTGTVREIDTTYPYPYTVDFTDGREGRGWDTFRDDEIESADESTTTPVDSELRERLIELVTKYAPTEESPEDIVAQAQIFESYIQGATK